MTTILKISKGAAGREEAIGALREAGIGVVEVDDWEAASEALRNCEAALVVCDGEVLESADTATLKKAISALGAGKKTMAVAPHVSRAPFHELPKPPPPLGRRVDLLESGEVPAEGKKAAIRKMGGKNQEK